MPEDKKKKSKLLKCYSNKLLTPGVLSLIAITYHCLKGQSESTTQQGNTRLLPLIMVGFQENIYEISSTIFTLIRPGVTKLQLKSWVFY